MPAQQGLHRVLSGLHHTPAHQAGHAPQAEQSATSGAQLFGGCPSWPTSSIKGLVGVSGVYNCHGLADHFDQRGLYRRLFERIMAVDGQPQLKLVSPTYCVKVRAQGAGGQALVPHLACSILRTPAADHVVL